MHKIHEKEFTLEDFSCEHLISDWIGDNNDAMYYWNMPDKETPSQLFASPMDSLKVIIGLLNANREVYLKTKDKKYWWQMIQLLPSSYNQTRNVMMNYEVLCNIYRSRRGHRLDEWREFCKWIETLPYSDLITGNVSRGMRQAAGILDEAIESYGKTDEANDIIDKICAIGNPNPVSVEDIKECMKNFDPNDGVRNHVTMIGDD